MAKVDILNTLYMKAIDPLKFRYDTLSAPPLYSLLSPQDIFELYKIASSLRLSSKPKEKYVLIDKIMYQRGFKFLASGTNRVIYKHLEIPTIIVKVALDKVGLSDNPNEYKNQYYIRPFCTKCFEVSQCGTVGIFERVQPIVNKIEFKLIAEDVFNMLIENIIGKYVLDDIGAKFFMNYGIREGWGPVLLDYPYVYELDNSKLQCNVIDQFGMPCGGEIDYDDGFNELHCTKCGKQYFARDLKQYVENNGITIKKGDLQDMVIEIVRGDSVLEVIENQKTTSVIKPTVVEVSAPFNKKEEKLSKPAVEISIVTGEEPPVTAEQVENLNKIMKGGHSENKKHHKNTPSNNHHNRNVASADLSTGDVQSYLQHVAPENHQLPPADNTEKVAEAISDEMTGLDADVNNDNYVDLEAERPLPITAKPAQSQVAKTIKCDRIEFATDGSDLASVY